MLSYPRSLIILAILVSISILSVKSQNELRVLEEKLEGCWLKAYGRGVGKPITTCHKGDEKNGLLCYPECETGYTGVGPVCWQNCLNNYRDDGAFCYKPSSYGRGAGYPLWSKQKCNDENSNGCEKYGLLYYPKCKTGFHNVGCCICSPDCPSGQTDIGISCAKKSYGRGAGTPLTCEDGEQYDAGLCYTPCSEGYDNVGPVCWGRCPQGFTQCGALCLKNQSCSSQIKQYFNGVMGIIKAFAEGKIVDGIIDVGSFSKDFIFDVCN